MSRPVATPRADIRAASRHGSFRHSTDGHSGDRGLCRFGGRKDWAECGVREIPEARGGPGLCLPRSFAPDRESVAPGPKERPLLIDGGGVFYAWGLPREK